MTAGAKQRSETTVRTAMRYIRPGTEAIAEVTDLLDLGRGHR